MLSTDESPTVTRSVLTTHRWHVWLLRGATRWMLSCVSAGGYFFAPGISGLERADAADLVTPARWWRHEAARGIAELEARIAEQDAGLPD